LTAIPAPHADHCWHRDRAALVPQIVSPVKTSLRYACCACHDAAYLPVSIDELEAPPRVAGAHLYDARDGGGCRVCGCAGDARA
jgi:hypothetical protein